jgi:two-component system chemotaxis response regulator CheY
MTISIEPDLLTLEAPTMKTEGERMPRILLVEDAPFLRYAFGRLLRLQGFEVREAYDGQDAIDAVMDFQPHLILTDLMMPVMGGLDLIRKLRNSPETMNIPVIAITADATPLAERQAREAGVADFIAKPVDLPELVQRLRDLIGASTLA